MNHRRTPAAGHRPRAGVRFAAGSCAWCGDPFVIDRDLAPWSRARTCSDSCRARLGNRGRHAGSCEHCAMVEAFVVEHERQRTAIEDGGWRDESARVTVTLGDYMRHYPWSGAGEPDEQDIAA